MIAVQPSLNLDANIEPQERSTDALISLSRSITLSTVVIIVMGVVGMLLTTRWGIGTSPDSVDYIRAARQFARIDETNGGRQVSLTHHAPLYSAFLALPGILGFDPLVASRWLNALLLGLNTLLVSLIVRYCSSNTPAPTILSAALMSGSAAILSIHVMAWTEPLFIFLGLLGFIFLVRYLQNTQFGFLFSSAVLIGLAFLTRYAGVALILSGALAIVILKSGPVRKRFSIALLFVIISSIPTTLWIMRNLWLAGTAANRQLVFHPITKSQLWLAVCTISDFLLVPRFAPKEIRISLLVLATAGILIVFLSVTRASRSASIQAPSFPQAIKLLLIFVGVYLSFLAISISCFDANTPLDFRILSPLLVAGILLGSLLFDGSWPLLRKLPTFRMTLSMMLVVFVMVHCLAGATLVIEGYFQGCGLSSLRWQRSALMAQVRDSSPGITIFSNTPEAIYLHTGKQAEPLPRRFFSTTQRANGNYSRELALLRTELEASDGIVVFFNSLSVRTSLATEEELEDQLSLCVTSRQSDGVILSAKRCQQ